MIKWLCRDYKVLVKDGLGEMKVHHGQVHDYLGMILDFLHNGEVHISMVKYIVDVYETLEKAQAKIDDGFVEVKNQKNNLQLTAALENIFAIMRSATS